MAVRVTGFWIHGFYDNYLHVHAPGAGTFEVLDPNGEVGPFSLRVRAPAGWGPVPACVYSTDKRYPVRREVIITEEDVRGYDDSSSDRN